MALEITSVGGKWIQFLLSFPPLNLRQDLEDHLFDNNPEYEDCGCILIMLMIVVSECFSQIQKQRDVGDVCDEYLRSAITILNCTHPHHYHQPHPRWKRKKSCYSSSERGGHCRYISTANFFTDTSRRSQTIYHLVIPLLCHFAI